MKKSTWFRLLFLISCITMSCLSVSVFISTGNWILSIMTLIVPFWMSILMYYIIKYHIGELNENNQSQNM